MICQEQIKKYKYFPNDQDGLDTDLVFRVKHIKVDII